MADQSDDQATRKEDSRRIPKEFCDIERHLKFFMGRAHETESHVAQTMRLSPRDPLQFHWYYLIGVADFYLGRSFRALSRWHKSVELNAKWALSHFVLAAVLAQRAFSPNRQKCVPPRGYSPPTSLL